LWRDCASVVVLYAGQVVEEADVHALRATAPSVYPRAAGGAAFGKSSAENAAGGN
jgi:ABC-type dipeptide/oligopeptide/nickel transport system ATPase component